MPIFPNEAALTGAAVLQTALANSKLHLFKSGTVVGAETTLVDLDAAECDFDGYTAGGVTITAWLAPLLKAGGGAFIESGYKQFQYVDGVGHVTNIAGGWYITTSGGALWSADNFAVPVPFQADGQGVNLDIIQNYGTP